MNIKKLCALMLLLSLEKVWAGEFQPPSTLGVIYVVGETLAVRDPSTPVASYLPSTFGSMPLFDVSYGAQNNGTEVDRASNGAADVRDARREPLATSARRQLEARFTQPAPALAPAAANTADFVSSRDQKEQKEFKAPTDSPQQ